jgi:hypothetical protein
MSLLPKLISDTTGLAADGETGILNLFCPHPASHSSLSRTFLGLVILLVLKESVGA